MKGEFGATLLLRNSRSCTSRAPKLMKIRALHETMCRGLRAADPHSRAGRAGLKPAAHDPEDPIFEEGIYGMAVNMT